MAVRVLRADLERALKFVLAAVSKEDITPVLTGVKWTADGGKLKLIATDRYRVCAATIDVEDGAELDVLMTAAQAKWILTNKHMPLRVFDKQFVEVSATERKPAPAITARIVADDHEGANEFSMTAEGIKGNFPPVERLFVEQGKVERADVVGLTPELLDFLKLMPEWRGSPIKMFPPPVGENKMAPVQFESLDGRLRALLQPNVLLR